MEIIATIDSEKASGYTVCDVEVEQMGSTEYGEVKVTIIPRDEGKEVTFNLSSDSLVLLASELLKYFCGGD